MGKHQVQTKLAVSIASDPLCLENGVCLRERGPPVFTEIAIFKVEGFLWYRHETLDDLHVVHVVWHAFHAKLLVSSLSNFIFGFDIQPNVHRIFLFRQLDHPVIHLAE